MHGYVDRQTRVTAPRASEWAELLSWLNRGLRANTADSATRLQSELPTALDPPDLELHSVVKLDGRYASHAFARIIEITAEGCTLPFAMIGLVYTDPEFRNRGLAARCIARCVETLRHRGVPLVGLWSDLESFYKRLGFEPAGQAFIYHLSHDDCERATLENCEKWKIHQPDQSDWPALEALYNAKPSRAVRKPGDLQRLAAAPETQVIAAYTDGVIRAYAAIGRGDDFHGIVHDWAGTPDAVVACLSELSRPAPIGWLTGPAPEAAVSLVARSGCVPVSSHFALLQVLDPGRIWSETRKLNDTEEELAWQSQDTGFLVQTPNVEIDLSHEETLQLLFGPKPFPRTRIAQALSPAMQTPWPLFVWGFDSN